MELVIKYLLWFLFSGSLLFIGYMIYLSIIMYKERKNYEILVFPPDGIYYNFPHYTSKEIAYNKIKLLEFLIKNGYPESLALKNIDKVKLLNSNENEYTL